ncbi:MAG: hypothetical protein ACREJ3_05340, partial [Polyangiaceae bacterium]
ELLAMGVIAGVVAFEVSSMIRSRDPRSRNLPELRTERAVFEVHPGPAQVTAESSDGDVRRDVDLSIVVDGKVSPLVLGPSALGPGSRCLHAAVPLSVDDATLNATITMCAETVRDALRVELSAPPDPRMNGHAFALQAELMSEGQVVFVAGVGQLADSATVSGSSLLLDTEPHAIAIT